MDRIFERAFARAQAQDADEGPASTSGRHGGAPAAPPEKELTPIQRILKCWDDKEYFGWDTLRDRNAVSTCASRGLANGANARRIACMRKPSFPC